MWGCLVTPTPPHPKVGGGRLQLSLGGGPGRSCDIFRVLRPCQVLEDSNFRVSSSYWKPAAQNGKGAWKYGPHADSKSKGRATGPHKSLCSTRTSPAARSFGEGVETVVS